MNALKQRAREDLEALSSEDASAQIADLLPLVKTLSADDDGLSELASICAAYSLERPATQVAATETTKESPPDSPSEDSDATGDVADESRADETPSEARSRRRRGGRDNSGGARSDGDGKGDSNRGSRRRGRGGSSPRRS